MKFRKGTNNYNKKIIFLQAYTYLNSAGKVHVIYDVTHTINEPLEIYISQILIANSLY